MSDYPYEDSTWLPAAGDLAQVWWGGLAGDDKGAWAVTQDWGGPRHFVHLTRPDRVGGTMAIDRQHVRLVEPAEARLARELMEERR